MFEIPTYKELKEMVLNYLTKDQEALTTSKLAKNLFMTMHKS